jgi:hypothetical protein
MTLTRTDDANLRVCLGCLREWYSAVHYSPEPVYCESCGSPLVETLERTLDLLSRIESSHGSLRHQPRGGRGVPQ